MHAPLSDFLTIATERGLWLLAQREGPAVAEPAADAANDVNPIIHFLSNPINLILISAILFMFIVVRPQQRQAKEQQKALSELKKNDKVITHAGIHGTVTQWNAGDAVVTIRIDENSGAKMTVNRDSIAKIITSDTKE